MAMSGTTPAHFPQLKAEAFDNWLFRLQCLLNESQELPKDEYKSFLDPGLQRHLKSRSLDNRQGIRLDVPTASNNGASVKPIFPAAFATNLTVNTLEILEGTLTMRRSATHVTKLNTRLIESIPGGDTAFMSRMMAMGANANATCRLNHVSACHIAAMHDHDALDLLLRSGADSSRSDKQGRTPLHLAAWAGNIKQIALLLNFPEALRKSVVDHVVWSSETVEEVTRHSLPVNKLTNVPCRLNVESTLPDEWSDGMEHNCRIIKEILPLFQQGWTALHAASARAQHHSVQLLLAAGADVSAQDLLCRTPLDVAGCAHCSGYKIDVNNFNETVKLLLKAGGKFTRCYHKNNPLDTPLHTAVELGSEAAVEQLLQDGASASVWDSRGLTAMHVCVEKRNKELLQLLANHKYSNEDPYLATVDVKDRTGFTVLCAAVKAEWIQGVCIALGAGASITMKANEESPIHIAAQSGNIDILQEIITVAKYNSTIDFRNEKGETALFKAINNNQLDSLKLLLEAGSSIEIEISNKANVFHVAAKHGSKDVLEHLLEYNSNITAKLINKFDSMGPPLFYAVLKNHLICAELLVCKGAQVNAFLECNNLIDTDILTWTSILHIAARYNHYKIAEIIIKHDSETIHATDSAGRTPLHEACCHGNREMIVILLRKGADLSGAGRNGLSKTKLPPIDILMNNLSKPTEFMQKIFDSYISSQGVSLQESNCEVVVDYGVLVPNKENMKRMRVIKALINTGNRYDQHKLLLHPLVQSFLYLKWRSLLSFFYSILILHMCFVLSLNVYAISVFYYKDKNKDVPSILRSSLWIHIIYLTVCLTTIQEIIFIKIKSKRYFLCLETWLKFWSITLAVFLPRVVSWDTESSAEWARLIATVALLLSWFEMMFLLSRFPNWGYYVLMFGKVANKVFKILVSFVFLIFGFSVSFMIQFRAKPPFEGPWSAFITTLVMMTSEFDYNQTLSAVDASASIIILRLIFVSFLILVSIVLMNLLVGVAVNDVNNLEIIGNIKRLEKQVEFITSLEDIVCNKFIKKILPKSLYKKWLKNIKWENVIVLRPREATCSNCNRLPARLREAIFEKAQLQKTQSDDQQGTMLYQMKLDEMYKVIVKKDGSGPPKPDGPDNALNKIIEDINNIRGDIEIIKNFIVTTKCRSFSSNKSAPLLVISNNN